MVVTTPRRVTTPCPADAVDATDEKGTHRVVRAAGRLTMGVLRLPNTQKHRFTTTIEMLTSKRVVSNVCSSERRWQDWRLTSILTG